MNIFKNKIRRSPRFPSLDISRGMAIVLMIEAHVLILIPFITDYSGMFAAPFFFIIAGVSYELFLKSRFNKGITKSVIYFETFWRAIILFLVTISITILGMILFSWYYHSIGSFGLTWTVFEVIAIGYLLGLLIYRDSLKLITIIVIFSVSYLISQFQINNLYFLINPANLSMNMIAYFVFGQLISGIYQKKYLSSKGNSKLLMYSGLFVLISLVIFNIFPVQLVSQDRSTFSLFLVISSILLLVILFFIRIVDIEKHLNRLLSPFASIGKIAFTAFYLNVLIIFILKRIILAYVPPSYAVNIVIVVLTVAILTIIERIWVRYNYFLSLEWLLRQGANIMTKQSENINNNYFNRENEEKN